MAKQRMTRTSSKRKEEKPWRPFAFLDSKANWFIVLLFGISLLQSKVTIDPNIAIRFLGLGIFLLTYSIYFFVIKKEPFLIGLPKLSKWIFLSLTLYLFWSAFGISFATNAAEAIYGVTKNALDVLLVYIAFRAAIDDEFNWDRLIKAVVWLGLIHGLIGIEQYFGWDITDFRGTAEPFGLMVNRNLFGSFLVILLPFSLGYLLLKRSWNILAIVVSAALAFMIYQSETRSAWIAGLIVIGLIGISHFLKSFSPKKFYLTLAVFSALTIGALLAYNHYVLQAKKRDRTSQQDAKNDKARVKKASANERMVLWKETSFMVGERPLTGVGLGNWKLEIPRYHQGGTRIDYGKIIRIRPHNIYLHTMAETGIVGFLLFYGPWIAIGILGLIALTKEQDQKQRTLIIIFLVTLIGFSSDGMFSFPTERISHSTFLFAILGFLLALVSTKKTDKNSAISNRLFSTIPIAITVWAIFLGKEKHDFENHMNKARVHYIKNRNELALQSVEQGKSKWVTLEINNDPIELVGALTLKKMKRFGKAIEQVEASIVHNPYSNRILNTKGAILTDMKKHEEAIESYKLALEYSPKHELSIKNMALNYYFTGEYRKCLNNLKEVKIKKEDETFQRLRRAARAKLKAQKKASKK